VPFSVTLPWETPVTERDGSSWAAICLRRRIGYGAVHAGSRAALEDDGGARVVRTVRRRDGPGGCRTRRPRRRAAQKPGLIPDATTSTKPAPLSLFIIRAGSSGSRGDVSSPTMANSPSDLLHSKAYRRPRSGDGATDTASVNAWVGAADPKRSVPKPCLQTAAAATASSLSRVRAGAAEVESPGVSVPFARRSRLEEVAAFGSLENGADGALGICTRWCGDKNTKAGRGGPMLTVEEVHVAPTLSVRPPLATRRSATPPTNGDGPGPCSLDRRGWPMVGPNHANPAPSTSGCAIALRSGRTTLALAAAQQVRGLRNGPRAGDCARRRATRLVGPRGRKIARNQLHG
jgi:hypothetical protein